MAEGFQADFLGIMTRTSFFEMITPLEKASTVQPPLPQFDEEYCEWVSLLDAVANAHEHFTMIELGAGWGRWLVRAAFAARQYRDLRCRFVGVEAEPTHFQWMKEHFRDNGLDPTEHDLVQAAVAARDGDVWFRVGSPFEWYGQQIVPTPKSWWEKLHPPDVRESGYTFRLRKVRAVSLKTLLRPLQRVDLIDLDVQGAELAVLESARDALDSKVKRVHVEVHNRAVESGIRRLFQDLSWTKVADYPDDSVSDTPWGRIKFQDGHQDWLNSRRL